MKDMKEKTTINEYFLRGIKEKNQIFYNLIKEDELNFSIREIQVKNGFINAEIELYDGKRKGIVYYVGTKNNVLILSIGIENRPRLREEVLDNIIEEGKNAKRFFSYRISDRISREILKMIGEERNYSYISDKKSKRKRISHVTIISRHETVLKWEPNAEKSYYGERVIAQYFYLGSVLFIKWIREKDAKLSKDDYSRMGIQWNKAIYQNIGKGFGVKFELIDFENEFKLFEKGLDFLPIIQQNIKEEPDTRYTKSEVSEYKDAGGEEKNPFRITIRQIEQDIEERI